ncbi:putative phospholipid-transporting ATPase IA [Toxocara canis]|uniref:Phospholipid-transporting ATPase n=1 Tax=Toxocara canis TaxID=6265 RepID=A0A0B2UPM6_TOXCA|nr:putative phospholipid-transporting ATPase IA [Toxocara canis]
MKHEAAVNVFMKSALQSWCGEFLLSGEAFVRWSFGYLRRENWYETFSEGTTMPDPHVSPHSRNIHVNGVQTERFCSNVISTCKYSVLSFFPRFILEQFRRYNNVFFLVIALLQVNVGDIIRVENEQLFPADMALLSSSEPHAMAYIETSNLDGETNLKIRQGLECTEGLVTLQSICELKCDIECEQPNRQVNEFTGTLKIADLQRPLGINQILLRGARLKNTRWICGAVIYTGHDAKLLMNSRLAPLKRSNIDVMTNRRIVFLFFVLVTLAVVSAIGAHFYEETRLKDAYYLEFFGSKQSNFFWNVLTFFILYNNLIPISLQVTLELVRFFQASYINCDEKMYDEASDTCAAARTSNLNEELGQVKFVMSDKTGTLTRNVMKFKRCSVAGVNYGNDETDEFDDDSIIKSINSVSGNSEWLVEFLRMMAVCHTVVPEMDDEGVLGYQASSPDEGALVRGAAALGFIFHTRKPNLLIIDALGKEETYEVLNVLEFTSDRKRMGVVVRCPDKVIRLYVKGADSVIFDRLRAECKYRAETLAHLSEYASKGYRTLCFAMRVVQEDEYKSWAADFQTASVAIEQREKKLAACAEKIECDLVLVGATAIEDKLQQGVPETIRALMGADIRIWMLTGDKRETAVNIANASALCTSSTTQLVVDTNTYDETYSKLTAFVSKARTLNRSNVEFALIIDGSSLHYAMTGECRSLLGELALSCRAVVCCRMTPMQKADVVELVRSCGEHVVLAVGDGANDVAMIQAGFRLDFSKAKRAANVGVGISGEEGLQAASASDYAIAQFRFLQRLLLVHGAWNFDRSVKVILYSFYKNICLYLIELWFALYSAFSGQTIFERWTIGLFNVAFTALPPVVLGLFDRPVSDSMMLSCPALYLSFQKRAFSLPFVVATVCLKALLECNSWTTIVVCSSIGSILLWIVFLVIYAMLWPYIPFGQEMCGLAYMMMSSYSFWLAFVLIPVIALLTDFVAKVISASVVPTPRELACLHEQTRIKAAEVGIVCGEVGAASEGRRLNGALNEAVVYGSVTELAEIGGSLSPTRRPAKEEQRRDGESSSTERGQPPREPFIENALLLENAESTLAEGLREESSETRSVPSDSSLQRGYAFSQEESGVVPQSEVIRCYDSTFIKPHGK